MGDNRQATRAPGPAPDAKKKDAGAEAGGGGAVPEGAAAEPGAALIALGAQHAATLLGMLQSAGGNAEVNELQGLETGKQLAAQAKADKENIDSMTDGQKIEKFGGKGEGSGKAPPPDGTPPDGVPQPAQVQGFHTSRAGQLGQLASQHKTVAGQLAGAGAAEGLAPAMAGFLGQAGAQSLNQAMSLGQLAQAYLQTSKELGKSEFVGAAMPGSSIQGDYEARAAGIQAQVAALDAMTAEYAAALAAEEAKIAGVNTQISEIQLQIAAAQAAKAEKKGGATQMTEGAGAMAKGASGASAAKEPAPKAPETKAPAAKGADAKSGAGADTKSSGAEAKTPAPAPAPAAPAAAEGADPVPGLMAQITSMNQQKAAIERAIRSNQGLVSTMKAYRDQMTALLSAYQTVLGITPPTA
jgi:hypothetical protein